LVGHRSFTQDDDRKRKGLPADAAGAVTIWKKEVELMGAERFYIYRCGDTDACAVTAVKNEPRLSAQPSAPWRFWMQVTRYQVADASHGFGFDAAISKILSDGFFLFTGTAKLLGPPSLSPRREAANV
jgi:hypothetical protein